MYQFIGFRKRASNHEAQPHCSGITSTDIFSSHPDPELLTELRQTMSTINTVFNHFEEVVDPTLIDCYIYELKAAHLRYQFLLRHIKQQENTI